MNEEIKNKAKFYLRRYAEIVSDKIINIKSNLEFDRNVLQKRGAYANDWYAVILQKRIKSRKQGLEASINVLKDIDEVGNSLS